MAYPAILKCNIKEPQTLQCGHEQCPLHRRDLQEESGTTAPLSDHQKLHVLQRHTELICRLKYAGIFDTETTEGENYQIAFPQVMSRLNSRGK